MRDQDLSALDAAHIAAGCNRGTIDPRDVLAAFQHRIARHNPSLNAIVGDAPADLDRQVEHLRQRIGRGEQPPLAGVPVVVKDNLWVRGHRVTQGSLLRLLQVRSRYSPTH